MSSRIQNVKVTAMNQNKQKSPLIGDKEQMLGEKYARKNKALASKIKYLYPLCIALHT